MDFNTEHSDLNKFYANHQDLWGGSRMDALVGLVESSILEPKDLIKRGEVPVSYIFAIEPTSDDENVHRAFESLMSAAGMIRFFAAVNEVSDYDNQSRKETYSIKNPDEVALAFEEAANATMTSLAKAQVGAVYTVESTLTESVCVNKSRSELRQYVIERILAGVPDVSSSVINKVNEAFTDFIRKIRPFQVSEASEPSTVNHCVVVHYIAMSDETGGAASPVPQPKTRVVYFKCKAGDWDRAMQKPEGSNKDEKIPFVMEILVQEMRLDEGLFRRRKSNWVTMAKFIAENKDDVKEVVESQGIEGFGRKTAFVFEA
ncbi:hypothetical protein A0O28_0108330 [Trichoderma guizhouense]|uniref:Uncharacterized protein n=1 Tax=Trichoderma guizhouense TaxID=1491466 RepID=A0A1T3CJ63_9HYPO|nr:hypothetical protein A0O28_0108330 [Trichoderma guizhouense]